MRAGCGMLLGVQVEQPACGPPHSIQPIVVSSYSPGSVSPDDWKLEGCFNDGYH